MDYVLVRHVILVFHYRTRRIALIMMLDLGSEHPPMLKYRWYFLGTHN